MSRNDLWNSLTLKEAAAFRKQVESGEFDLDNLRGFVKHIIGMCSDEEPHLEISAALWKMTDYLSIMRECQRRSATESEKKP